MKRIAFKMHLHHGQKEEYQRRHQEIWPELKKLLAETGVRDYSIFLDEETLTLFAIMKIEHPGSLDLLPQHAIMKKWWAYMSDIMTVNADQSPVSTALGEVFHLD